VIATENLRAPWGRRLLGLALAAGIAWLGLVAQPTPARAGVPNVVGVGCNLAGDFIDGFAGKACGAVGKAFGLLSGGAGQAAGIAGAAVAVLGGARAALSEAARILGRTTAPHLTSAWFSAAYWRVAALAAVLTLPFLFAAAAQAVIRSDLALLLRAAFAYLPLALLTISIAAPLTMMLLAASDEMSALVASAGGGGAARFLTVVSRLSVGVGLLFRTPFLAIVIGVLMVATALALTLELMVREAAIYVVVLMLPLAFAAMVWPARRVWAARLVEILVAVILAKFVIVAVLTLAGAALGQIGHLGLTAVLGGIALLVLAVASPWVLMRLIPFAELASGAGGALSVYDSITGRLGGIEGQARSADEALQDWWAQMTSDHRSRPADITRPTLPPVSEPPAHSAAGEEPTEGSGADIEPRPPAGGHAADPMKPGFKPATDDQSPPDTTTATVGYERDLAAADASRADAAAGSLRADAAAGSPCADAAADSLRADAADPNSEQKLSADGLRVLSPEPWLTDPDRLPERLGDLRTLGQRGWIFTGEPPEDAGGPPSDSQPAPEEDR